MSTTKSGIDRDIVEIAQSIEFMGEDCSEIAESMDGLTRSDYLYPQISKLKALSTKLQYNVLRLISITGQKNPAEHDMPF